MVEKHETLSEIKLPIEWIVDDTTPSGYASNLVVQRTDHEFILSFFEMKPPLLVGEPEEQLEQAQRLGSIKSRCISQITIPVTRMGEFLTAMNSNYQRFLDENEGND